VIGAVTIPRALVVLGAIVWSTATASAVTITGSVIGEGARPIAGATVFVVGALPPCTTTTGPEGTFSFSCEATGTHTVRATFGDLRPWQVDDVPLEPNADVHLNFMLLPATTASAPAAAHGLWTRPVPNPVRPTVGVGQETWLLAAMLLVPAGFVLTAVMIGVQALGRR